MDATRPEDLGKDAIEDAVADFTANESRSVFTNLVPILNVYENIVLPVELDGDTVAQKFLDEIRCV